MATQLSFCPQACHTGDTSGSQQRRPPSRWVGEWGSPFLLPPTEGENHSTLGFILIVLNIAQIKLRFLYTKFSQNQFPFIYCLTVISSSTCFCIIKLGELLHLSVQGICSPFLCIHQQPGQQPPSEVHIYLLNQPLPSTAWIASQWNFS